MNNSEKLPYFYGGIVITFPPDTPVAKLEETLPLGTTYCVYPSYVEATYLEVDNLFCWEVDSLLTELFSKADIDLLQRIVDTLQGHILIDISFHHYSRFPSLLFSGLNMSIIHRLRAEISIDPY